MGPLWIGPSLKLNAVPSVQGREAGNHLLQLGIAAEVDVVFAQSRRIKATHVDCPTVSESGA
jgi:hypothetical protein